jgi:hypothetical protein
MSGKAKNFFKMGDKKILLGKYPSYPRKTQNHMSQDEFFSVKLLTKS